jgi:hypothetical protein
MEIYMRRISSALVLALSCSLLGSQQPQSPGPADITPSKQASAATPPPPHTLLDGTPVKLRLSQSISSEDAKVGQEVPFEVVEEVKVDDFVVLPKGATAIANVTEAEHKKRMGRAGKLNMTISYARLAIKRRLHYAPSRNPKAADMLEQ